MNTSALKQAAAQAALEQIRPDLDRDTYIGIGTGSTVNCFIDVLAASKLPFRGAVASSQASAQRLQQQGIELVSLNDIEELPFYIDGADEANRSLELIKGGGGALTREKIIAAVAQQFICIADESKQVDTLGQFPLPVEVIPMARSYVAQALTQLGGQPVYRDGMITDNGHIILDVHHLHIDDAKALETQINQITGVICNGLFAHRSADVLLLASATGVKTYSVINTSSQQGEYY